RSGVTDFSCKRPRQQPIVNRQWLAEVGGDVRYLMHVVDDRYVFLYLELLVAGQISIDHVMHSLIIGTPQAAIVHVRDHPFGLGCSQHPERSIKLALCNSLKRHNQDGGGYRE